jgi:hypothetical protein
MEKDIVRTRVTLARGAVTPKFEDNGVSCAHKVQEEQEKWRI